MKIFNADQIKEWDRQTMQQEPISDIGLMERAAAACHDWILSMGMTECAFSIYCGKGNNGGDGLVLARLLSAQVSRVDVFILESGKPGTPAFQHQLSQLHHYPVQLHYLQDAVAFLETPEGGVIIDALFGSGLNRPVEGRTAALIEHLNRQQGTIVSIDVPSGMMIDKSSKGCSMVRADHTLSFQAYKLAFMMAENAANLGRLQLLDIGLAADYASNTSSINQTLDYQAIQDIYQPRKAWAHKGTYGHALLVAGSYGKIGAALLSARACLRSGVGLLSCHTPSCGYEILQGNVPEAMVLSDMHASLITGVDDDLDKYKCIGVGPGLGTATETAQMLQRLIARTTVPMVIDADALNILSRHKDWLADVPTNSILTPHPKEFERLFGTSANDFERAELARERAVDLGFTIILKGHHTFIALPSGIGYFNTTGNAGMATGGMGDVLTGLLTGLLAQGYAAEDAAKIGVYLHGLAGDLGAAALSKESLIAGDVVDHIGQAFLRLQ